MMTAQEAAKLQKKTNEKKEPKEIQKINTIMKNIAQRAIGGHNFYFYQPLVTKAMAKTLIEKGYKLKWRGEWKMEARGSWYGCYKVYKEDKAKPLTLEDYKKADAYPNVFIYW